MPTKTAPTKQIPLPRGIKNNNPGNIRHSTAMWLGRARTQPDTSFVSFTAPEYGIRSMARILVNYQKRYKLTTIEKMITRWAPPKENDTDAYIAAVARSVGIAKDKDINIRSDMSSFLRLVKAIINHENGASVLHGRPEWYDNQTLSKGITMAISPDPAKNEDRSLSHILIVEHFRNT